MELTINSELQDLLQPLTTEEYSLLENSIVTANGCREPLIVWGSILVDGHNRYEICNKHNITFTTSSIAFNNIEESKDWIDRNQAGRRNMTADFEMVVIGRIFNRTKKPQGGTGANQHKQKDKTCPSASTAKKLGEKYGLHPNTVKNYGKFADEVEKDPELKKAVKEGRKAAKDYKKGKKKAKKQQERQSKIDKSKSMKVPDMITFNQGDCLELSKELKDDSISLIMTDPPYPAEFIDCWTKLGKIAMRVLQPSGFCVAYSGQIHLPEVIRRLVAEGLVYYWQFILLHNGRRASCQGRKIDFGYKPILIFQKPPFKQLPNFVSDIVKGSGSEKSDHEWQQAEGELKQLFDIFYEGGTVLEPYAGSGTVLSYCKSNKIPVIGYELDKDTYQIAVSRIGETK